MARLFFYFRLSFFIFIFALYILSATGASAQTDTDRIAELQRQIEALEQEAEQYRGNIASEQAKANSLKGEINILNNQISKIQTQINITSKNISKTGIEIEGLEGNIFDTNRAIDYKRDAIGRLILEVYKQDKENLLLVLLKNTNISNFFMQVQQTASLNISLLELISDLNNEKKALEVQRNELEGKKTELETFNQKQKQQNNSLGQTKTGKNQLLAQTKGQEVAYQKMLAEVERKKSLFFTELKELETKIIQGGLYILHITAQNLPPKKTKLFQWPEDDYSFTQYYGCTNYAQNWGSGLTFSSRSCTSPGPYGGSIHNGIDMASGYASPIKSIGDGEIIANGKNDGWGNWVAIKHPPYDLVSVYGHMSAFEFLQVGTQVKAGQIIGYEGTTGNVTGSHLHLSLYKDFFTYVKEKNGQLYFNYFDGSINPLDYLR